MIYSMRSRLIFSFLAICVIGGGLSLAVGVRLLNRAVINEATNRIRLDLNTARGIYNNVESYIRLGLEIASQERNFQGALENHNINNLSECLQVLEQQIGLDFAGLVDSDGRTLIRLRNSNSTSLDASPANPAALFALHNHTTVSGTVIMDYGALFAEGPRLAEQARIELVATERSAFREEIEETSGMTITVAVPVYSGNSLVGALYGGVLLNRSTEIVDRVRETVFQNEMYRGNSIGTATIFFKDIRISTNVMTLDETRAIGTRVSEEVRNKVLGDSDRWIDRAFVVQDWYLTSYEPIVDAFGNQVGILSVGILETKYNEIKRNTILIFVLITGLGMLLAILLGFILGQRIFKPINYLIQWSRKVSTGDLSQESEPISRSEIGDLQITFGEMVTSLRERDIHQRQESDLLLLRSEKQASVGRLAAGVAHEINNPLTGVVTFTHMLLKRDDLGDDVRQDLEMIAKSTERVRKIVKGLLDFSRQSKIELEPTDINTLIDDTIPLIANQALVKGIFFCFDPCKDIPMITLDRMQFQSVLLNIYINAIDATEPGGHIDISTHLTFTPGESHTKGIEISILDTGKGIPPEILDKLFEPFFTTKEVGKGTGLGLSVSQGIVEHHGGTISVQSTVGIGSIFSIWIPIESGKEQI